MRGIRLLIALVRADAYGSGAFGPHVARAARHLAAAGRVALWAVGIGGLGLALLRWPSIHWVLAEAYAQGEPAERTAIAAVFTGLNSYLGNYIGEFLGELSISVFFLLSALAILEARDTALPRWMGYVGIATAIAGLVGMFRNTTNVVAPIAAVNNYLLPLWMVVFGSGLVRVSRSRSEAGGA